MVGKKGQKLIKYSPELGIKNEKGQFLKGHPGLEGAGRPVGQRDFRTDFDEVVNDIAKEEGLTRSEARKAILKKAYYEAKAGNFNFYKDVTDRNYGKVKETVDLGATDELKDLLLRVNKVIDD